MRGANVGFDSRTWSTYDGGIGIESTWCGWNYPGAGGSYYTLQLTENKPWYQPDRNAGWNSYPCPGGYGYGDYGWQPAGTYHFTYVDSDNPYGLDSDGNAYYP